MLNRHRALQQKKQFDAGSSWVNSNVVFANDKGGFIAYTTFHHQFNKLLREAGLPAIRFHDLRHSAATILLSMKIPANVVQQILGHRDVATTLGIYGHILQSMHDDVTDDMDSMFGE
jgi:integrase